jgi:hypothetical protein
VCGRFDRDEGFDRVDEPGFVLAAAVDQRLHRGTA